MRPLLLSLLAAQLVSGCALPNTSTISGANRPTLTLTGSPAEALLYVDGISHGLATQFDGRQGELAIEEGAHVVEVRLGSSILVKRSVFGSRGEKVNIEVSSGRQQ